MKTVMHSVLLGINALWMCSTDSHGCLKRGVQNSEAAHDCNYNGGFSLNERHAPAGAG